MSELLRYISAILEGYQGVKDEDANQVMTISMSVRELRKIYTALSNSDIQEGHQ